MSWQWERVGKGEGGWWERRSTQGSYHVVWASVCSEGLAPAGDACGVEGPWWVMRVACCPEPSTGARGISGISCRREAHPCLPAETLSLPVRYMHDDHLFSILFFFGFAKGLYFQQVNR